MHGGEVLVRCLERLGVSHLFSIPGIHSLPVYDALQKSSIVHVLNRHEQGTAFMADAYGRATGRPGVALTTGGPGAMNAFTGTGTAYNDHSPMLIISTQVHSSILNGRRGSLHELPGQLAIFKQVCVYAERAENLAGLPGKVYQAWDSALHWSRPAYLEIPNDLLCREEEMQASAFDPPPPSPRQPYTVERNGRTGSPGPAGLEEVAALLSRARVPVIWAGGGVVSAGAGRDLAELAEMLQCPVFTGLGGRGLIPEDHPLSLGRFATHPAAKNILGQCDLMLAAGVRFSEFATAGWTLALPENLVRIDQDQGVHSSPYPSSYAITGDAGPVIKDLTALIRGGLEKGTFSLSPPGYRIGLIEAAREEINRPGPSGTRREIAVLREIRNLLDPEDILAVDLTTLGYWAGQYFPVYRPRTFLYAQGFGPLGFALPAAIAGRIARPERRSVALCGDGGFMFTLQELAVAVDMGLDLVVVLVNDNCFGYLRHIQESVWGPGRDFAVRLANPDFTALAKSFGARAARVRGLENLPAALKEALEAGGGPALIEVQGEVKPPA